MSAATAKILILILNTLGLLEPRGRDFQNSPTPQHNAELLGTWWSSQRSKNNTIANNNKKRRPPRKLDAAPRSGSRPGPNLSEETRSFRGDIRETGLCSSSWVVRFHAPTVVFANSSAGVGAPPMLCNYAAAASARVGNRFLNREEK